VGATSGEDDPGIRRVQHRPLPETHGRESPGHAAVPLVGLRRHWLPGRVEALDRPERGGQDQDPRLDELRHETLAGNFYFLLETNEMFHSISKCSSTTRITFHGNLTKIRYSNVIPSAGHNILEPVLGRPSVQIIVANHY
jgi:hypothetical protein